MTSIRVAADLARADIPVMCAALAARLRSEPAVGTVRCDVRAVRKPSVVTVEALARLRQTAGRAGWGLELDGAGPELRNLLKLVGLSPLFGEPSAGFPGEPSTQFVGQAEQGEEPLGVEEVVDSRDPPV